MILPTVNREQSELERFSMSNNLTNRQKWIMGVKHGIVASIILFISVLVFEVVVKQPVRIEASFLDLWRFYGVTNIIFVSVLFGIIIAVQKRLFFTRASLYIWLWPLMLIIISLITLVLLFLYTTSLTAHGREILLGYLLFLWVPFSSACTLITIVNRVLYVLHKRKYG